MRSVNGRVDLLLDFLDQVLGIPSLSLHIRSRCLLLSRREGHLWQPQSSVDLLLVLLDQVQRSLRSLCTALCPWTNLLYNQHQYQYVYGATRYRYRRDHSTGHLASRCSRCRWLQRRHLASRLRSRGRSGPSSRRSRKSCLPQCLSHNRVRTRRKLCLPQGLGHNNRVGSTSPKL